MQAFLARGVYGEITRLARGYRVSRFFVYTLLWQLADLFAVPSATLLVTASRPQAEVDRHILLLRLVGRCSLESLAQVCAELGLPYHSVGYISQRLTTFAQALARWRTALLLVALSSLPGLPSKRLRHRHHSNALTPFANFLLS